MQNTVTTNKKAKAERISTCKVALLRELSTAGGQPVAGQGGSPVWEHWCTVPWAREHTPSAPQARTLL
jgi:hypothetical protein